MTWVINPSGTTGKDANGNAAEVVDTFQWMRDGIPIPGATGKEVDGAKYFPVAPTSGRSSP